MERKILKVGTRGSPLALAQTKLVCDKLQQQFESLTLEVTPIQTTGDKIQDRTLSKVGGKGLFTKEIEEALLRDEIDIAIHSMKDMPTHYPEGLIIPCVLEREDPRDVLIYSRKVTLKDLPQGITVGTSSLRREAQILYERPDLIVVPLRGNVQTRIKKIEEGQVDSTVLAYAGLKRLKIPQAASYVFSIEEMIPAVSQGIIGAECREDDLYVQNLLKSINHSLTYTCMEAERAFLRKLEGSCQTPIGGYAQLINNKLILKGFLSHPKGIRACVDSMEGSIQAPEKLGIDLASRMLSSVEVDFFKR